MMDLTIVKLSERESAALYPFCRKTVTDVIDPTLDELILVRQAREATRDGAPAHGWDSDESLNRFVEIMEQAKLRRIPYRYRKEYEEVLWGIHHAYRSTLALQDYESAEPEQLELRKMARKLSHDQSKMAETKLRKAREYFLEKAAKQELAPPHSNL